LTNSFRQTATAELQEYREKAKDVNTQWELRDNGLVTHQERLVVPDENNLRTRLIKFTHRYPLPTRERQRRASLLETDTTGQE
jgi:hypothetical protein